VCSITGPFWPDDASLFRRTEKKWSNAETSRNSISDPSGFETFAKFSEKRQKPPLAGRRPTLPPCLAKLALSVQLQVLNRSNRSNPEWEFKCSSDSLREKLAVCHRGSAGGSETSGTAQDHVVHVPAQVRLQSRLTHHGVDRVTVKEPLGHSNISTTMRYAHSNDEAKRRAVQRLRRATNDKPPPRAAANDDREQDSDKIGAIGCLTVLGEPHARGDRASEVDLEIVLDNRLENI